VTVSRKRGIFSTTSG